jgi:hypothetical protein
MKAFLLFLGLLVGIHHYPEVPPPVPSKPVLPHINPKLRPAQECDPNENYPGGELRHCTNRFNRKL